MDLKLHLKVCVRVSFLSFFKQTSGFFQDADRNIKTSGLGINFWAGVGHVLCSQITISRTLLLCGPIWSRDFSRLCCLESHRYWLSSPINQFYSVKIKSRKTGDQLSPTGWMQFDSHGLSWTVARFLKHSCQSKIKSCCFPLFLSLK